MDWLFIMWIAVNAGSQSATKVTEAQCKAGIDSVNDMLDPIMAICIGPKGERIVAANIRDRAAKLAPQTKPEVKPKAAGIGL